MLFCYPPLLQVRFHVLEKSEFKKKYQSSSEESKEDTNSFTMRNKLLLNCSVS